MSKELRCFIYSNFENLSEEGYQSLGDIVSDIYEEISEDSFSIEDKLKITDLKIRIEEKFRTSKAFNEFKKYVFDNPKEFKQRKILFVTPVIDIKANEKNAKYKISITFRLKGVSNEYDPKLGSYLTTDYDIKNPTFTIIFS